MHDLDELATDLRDRLLAAAGDGTADDLPTRIRALVDREAAVLDAPARAELAGRIAERAFGLGPLEPLLADPAVEELMVCGTGPVWVERGGRLEPTEVRFARERDLLVTIEDAAELRLRQPHVVRLEARPPSAEGRGEVTIRRLVRNALRMRPDRIIVGEVRGPEALHLLVALSTGHAGSLCTLHAGSAAEALRRLETLALMAGVGLPLVAIRDQIADAIGLVVRQERGVDGVRRVVEVAEVVRVAGGPAVREL